MQIYRGMAIGTDKPSRWMRWRVPHHLMDIIPPEKEFSVFDYRKMFFDEVRKIHERGGIPVAVGGTGLYVKAVVDGLSPQPGKSDEIRAEFREISEREGTARLYERLAREDPGVAARINPCDEKRIIRALEVLTLSGKSMTEWERKTESLESLGYHFRIFGIRTDRQTLYENINRRVDEMFRKGLEAEARRYRGRLSATSAQAIGYRELNDYFEGKSDLETARDKIKQNTRHYAKRQMTWFRRDERIQWIQGSTKEMLADIVRTVRQCR